MEHSQRNGAEGSSGGRVSWTPTAAEYFPYHDDYPRGSEGRTELELRTIENIVGKRRTTNFLHSYEQLEYPDAMPDDISDNESELDLNFDIASLASSQEDRLTWRGRMQTVLRHCYWSLLILSLLLLDTLTVLFEILIELGTFNNLNCIEDDSLATQAAFCHFFHDSNVSCAAPFSDTLCNTTLQNSSARLNLTFDQCQRLGAGIEEQICTCKFRYGLYTCVPFSVPDGVDPAEVLRGISIVILTFFTLEFIVKLIAFRLHLFLHKVEVFDACVVVLALVLDISTLFPSNGSASSDRPALIALRLWRVIRVASGIFICTQSHRKAVLSKERTKRKMAVHVLHKTQTCLQEEREEKEALLNLLKEHSIDYQPPKKSIPIKNEVNEMVAQFVRDSEQARHDCDSPSPVDW